MTEIAFSNCHRIAKTTLGLIKISSRFRHVMPVLSRSLHFCTMQLNQELLNKYNVPVPRYTSYATVPFWNEGIEVLRWKQNFKKEFQLKNFREGISLYILLPFCESLCTYCGCHKKITTNHSVEKRIHRRFA